MSISMLLIYNGEQKNEAIFGIQKVKQDSNNLQFINRMSGEMMIEGVWDP